MYETLVVMVKCPGYPGTDIFEMSMPVYPSLLRHILPGSCYNSVPVCWPQNSNSQKRREIVVTIKTNKKKCGVENFPKIALFCLSNSWEGTLIIQIDCPLMALKKSAHNRHTSACHWWAAMEVWLCPIEHERELVPRESDSIEYYIWVASQLTGFDIYRCLLQVGWLH